MRFHFKAGFLTERTAAALNELARQVERLTGINPGAGYSENERTQERLIVKLTAQNGATPPVYTGTEQSYTSADAYTDKPNGRTFSPTYSPIYERNGNRITSFPVYVEITRRIMIDSTPTYEFDAGASLAGGSFTLAGRTGSQTIASGDTMTLNRGAVTATDTWTPDDASASLPGDVSLSDQTMGGGNKTFTQSVIVNSNKTGSNYFRVWGGNVSYPLLEAVEYALTLGAVGYPIDLVTYNKVICDVTSGGDEIISELSFAGLTCTRVSGSTPPRLVLVYDQSNSASNLTAKHVRSSATAGYCEFDISTDAGTTYTLQFMADTSGSPYARLLLSGGSVQATYSIYKSGSGTTEHGATGTGGGGDTVTGGIITALGSGPNIQSLLDGISTTQGVILYYNGTDWVALATGTAGQYLKTGGAGANPSWSSTGGDLSGVPSAATVAKINGATLGTTTATDKNILIADGSQWVTRAVSGDVTISNTGTATVAAASDTAAGKIEIAVQSEMETGTDTTRAVVPGRQQYHPSACKCWISMKYNGVGVTNTAAYNVSSVGYTSAGVYTVTIDVDFSSANYAIVQGIEHQSGTGNRLVNWYSRAAGSFGVVNTNQTFSTPADAQLQNDFACFGDQ